MATASTIDASILQVVLRSRRYAMPAVRFVELKTINIVRIYKFHDTYNGVIVLPAQLCVGREGGSSSLFLFIAARGEPARMLFCGGFFVSFISIIKFPMMANAD